MPRYKSIEVEMREALINHFDAMEREGIDIDISKIEAKTMQIVEGARLSITNYHRLKGYLVEKYLKGRDIKKGMET
jgi:hypothetical protein